MQTDPSLSAPQNPVIILSHPQMGQNIGAAARVVRNFGLTEMRLIAPRDGWPNPDATAMAAGAFAQMQPVRVFDTANEALADLQYVLAVTARLRDMEKPVFGLADAMQKIGDMTRSGAHTGLLFGPEASGLDNREVVQCQGILTYDVDADFSSLNLAQAIGVAVSHWRTFHVTDPANETRKSLSPLARGDELDGMIAHLQEELTNARFFYPPEKAELMMQNLRNMFMRADLTHQEVQTFRGVIKALSRFRGQNSDNG